MSFLFFWPSPSSSLCEQDHRLPVHSVRVGTGRHGCECDPRHHRRKQGRHPWQHDPPYVSWTWTGVQTLADGCWRCSLSSELCPWWACCSSLWELEALNPVWPPLVETSLRNTRFVVIITKRRPAGWTFPPRTYAVIRNTSFVFFLFISSALSRISVSSAFVVY